MSSCSVFRARLPGRQGSEYAHYLVIRERTLSGAPSNLTFSKPNSDQTCENWWSFWAVSFKSKLPGYLLNMLWKNGCVRFAFNGRKTPPKSLQWAIVKQIQIKLVKIGDRFEHSPSKASFSAVFSTCSEKMVVSVLRSMVEKLIWNHPNGLPWNKFRSNLWKLVIVLSILLQKQASRLSSQHALKKWLCPFCV